MLGQVNSMYMICWSYEDFAFIVKIETWWRNRMETFSVLVALLCGEFTGDRRIPNTKASDAVL